MAVEISSLPQAYTIGISVSVAVVLCGVGFFLYAYNYRPWPDDQYRTWGDFFYGLIFGRSPGDGATSSLRVHEMQ